MNAPFAPFDDFTATPGDLQRFAELAAEDPEANLIERFEFFLAQDEGTAQQLFGFVPIILRSGWVAIVTPQAGGETLAFSVGLHYRFGHPEILLVGAIPPREAQAVINAVGAQVCMSSPGHSVESIGPNPEAGITARYEFERLDSSAELLDRYPYGYGWYFYRHFTSHDPREIPLLLGHARPTLEVREDGSGARRSSQQREVRVPMSEPYWIWVEPEGDHWRVRSFPTFAQHMARGDRVRCSGDTLAEVLERGPFYAIGVIFAGTSLGEKTELLADLRDMGCQLEHLVSESYGVSVPLEEWERALARLNEASESVGFEVLCGPDSPLPFSGPFEPDEED
ncbi:MAG TPA: hypothetical protein DEA08_04045 [Planctomycetes bacterium]|nr:hypothetical protein [Planctomycetota bacterium]